MRIVSGTKRAGTSMWMQILGASGMPVLGKPFPGKWGESIREANPRGFYETMFRQGVNFMTNPNPMTGDFVRPEQTERHVVKIFGPGLARSDLAYIGKVLVTVRDWRSYAASLGRLYAMEDAWKANRTVDEELGERDTDGEKRVRAGRLSPVLEWWFQNYELTRDIVTRRYPVHVLTYDRLLADPEREITAVLHWFGEGDAKAAIAAVDPSLRTQTAPAVDNPFGPDAERVFDDYYAAVHDGNGLSAALVEDMNALYLKLVGEWDAERTQRRSNNTRSGSSS